MNEKTRENVLWQRLRLFLWILAFAFPVTGIAMTRPAELAPLLVVLLHAVPFAVAALLMRRLQISATHFWGMLGATGFAMLSTLFIYAWLAWRVTTEWHGGADIGLGIALLTYPFLIGPIMLLGFSAGVRVLLRMEDRLGPSRMKHSIKGAPTPAFEEKPKDAAS